MCTVKLYIFNDTHNEEVDASANGAVERLGDCADEMKFHRKISATWLVYNRYNRQDLKIV